jgi:hypothetical protein
MDITRLLANNDGRIVGGLIVFIGTLVVVLVT